MGMKREQNREESTNESLYQDVASFQPQCTSVICGECDNWLCLLRDLRPAFEPLSAAPGYGAEFIGQVNAVGPLALAIASLPAGAFSQRYGIRRGLRIGFLFTILCRALLPLNEFLPGGWQQTWILSSYGVSWAFGALMLVNIPPFLMAATSEDERNPAFSVQAAI
jgi:MFS family permease